MASQVSKDIIRIYTRMSQYYILIGIMIKHKSKYNTFMIKGIMIKYKSKYYTFN